MSAHRLLPVFLFLFLPACVSVNLGSGKANRNSEVKFQAPGGDFKEISNSNADQAWQNSETGNTISFLTECPAPDSSLEGMTDEFTSFLKGKQVKEKKEDFFNGRESLQTWIEGKLDGIPMKMQSLVFKKNGCSYLLTYVGRSKVFDKDQSAFSTFTSRFEAP
jgi:hypothetical protein